MSCGAFVVQSRRQPQSDSSSQSGIAEASQTQPPAFSSCIHLRRRVIIPCIQRAYLLLVRSSRPGISNAHLAVAIAREVIVAGNSVLFTPATALIVQLAKAQADGRLAELLTN